MRSGIPPAFAPTTGTPLAIDSSTTNPSVSVSEGMTNTSAEAKAWLSASPVMTPVSTVLVPLKCSSRGSASGPVPTNASRALGFLVIGGKRTPTQMETFEWTGVVPSSLGVGWVGIGQQYGLELGFVGKSYVVLLDT